MLPEPRVGVPLPHPAHPDGAAPEGGQHQARPEEVCAVVGEEGAVAGQQGGGGGRRGGHREVDLLTLFYVFFIMCVCLLFSFLSFSSGLEGRRRSFTQPWKRNLPFWTSTLRHTVRRRVRLIGARHLLYYRTILYSSNDGNCIFIIGCHACLQTR